MHQSSPFDARRRCALPIHPPTYSLHPNFRDVDEGILIAIWFHRTQREVEPTLVADKLRPREPRYPPGYK